MCVSIVFKCVVCEHTYNIRRCNVLGIQKYSGMLLHQNTNYTINPADDVTVLFSLERRLVSPETPSEVARRVFKSFDPEGNNFISAVLLQDVLRALELVSEAE